MIPKVIPVIKDQEKKIDCKVLQCEDCPAILNENTAYVYLDKEKMKAHLACENCLKIQITSKQVVFSDTYEFYLKRKKSGFIDQIVEEFKRRKDGES